MAGDRKPISPRTAGVLIALLLAPLVYMPVQLANGATVPESPRRVCEERTGVAVKDLR